jgi:hypothetical protein
MFFIPGFLITIVTFPGVIVHEIAHQFFCRLFNLPVFEVCYFRVGNPAGYVVHEPPRNPMQQVLVGVAPFFVNSLVGAIIAFPAAIPILKFDAGSPLDYVLLWLGVSIAMHSFPSTGDANTIWKSLWSKENSAVVRWLAMPIVAFIYLGAIGSVFWLDLLYGVALVMLIPNALIGWLA